MRKVRLSSIFLWMNHEKSRFLPKTCFLALVNTPQLKMAKMAPKTLFRAHTPPRFFSTNYARLNTPLKVVFACICPYIFCRRCAVCCGFDIFNFLCGFLAFFGAFGTIPSWSYNVPFIAYIRRHLCPHISPDTWKSVLGREKQKRNNVFTNVF